MGNKDKTLLFIPMYNCEKQIVRVLGQLNENVCQYVSAVVIVNNRSTDNGEAVARQYLTEHRLPIPAEILRNDQNYGLGGSHKVAFDYAIRHNFDYIVVLHGDDQGSIDNLVPYLKSREYRYFDCFLGARFMKGSRLEGYSKFRTFGNVVYNMLFSAGTLSRIYDLGSGLNMYRVSVLKTHFYIRYKDNLMFNYCMVLGQKHFKLRVGFFPICWREDDQVSNVKMMNQAVTVLKLLGEYVLDENKFIHCEHRDTPVSKYTAKVIFSTAEHRENNEKQTV